MRMAISPISRLQAIRLGGSSNTPKPIPKETASMNEYRDFFQTG